MRQVQDTAGGPSTGSVTVSVSYALKHRLVNASANCYFYKGSINDENCQAT